MRFYININDQLLIFHANKSLKVIFKMKDVLFKLAIMII